MSSFSSRFKDAVVFLYEIEEPPSHLSNVSKWIWNGLNFLKHAALVIVLPVVLSFAASAALYYLLRFVAAILWPPTARDLYRKGIDLLNKADTLSTKKRRSAIHTKAFLMERHKTRETAYRCLRQSLRMDPSLTEVYITLAKEILYERAAYVRSCHGLAEKHPASAEGKVFEIPTMDGGTKTVGLRQRRRQIPESKSEPHERPQPTRPSQQRTRTRLADNARSVPAPLPVQACLAILEDGLLVDPSNDEMMQLRLEARALQDLEKQLSSGINGDRDQVTLTSPRAETSSVNSAALRMMAIGTFDDNTGMPILWR